MNAFPFLLLSLLLPASAASRAVALTGAGATFPYPIYSKWFDEYHRARPGVEINYQSIGSGGGIRQITERTVDFGATDGPMTDAQLAKVPGKLLHIPTVLGGVVPVFNLEGIDDLRLAGPVLADIFLGRITRWNDAAIRKDNPGAVLPDRAITVVHRSDGSGTTFVFSDYLAKASPAWEAGVGRGTALRWPVGLGGKGNEGVAGQVKQMPGSIGYVEMIYALQNDMSYAAVRNRAGTFVTADPASISAAAAGTAMPNDFRVSITDAAGAKAYPIASFTWLLVYERNDGEKGAQLRAFLEWMLGKGQAMAPELGYARLPPSVRTMVEKAVREIQ